MTRFFFYFLPDVSLREKTRGREILKKKKKSLAKGQSTTEEEKKKKEELNELVSEKVDQDWYVYL